MLAASGMTVEPTEEGAQERRGVEVCMHEQIPSPLEGSVMWQLGLFAQELHSIVPNPVPVVKSLTRRHIDPHPASD